jgi:hypothetical protein
MEGPPEPELRHRRSPLYRRIGGGGGWERTGRGRPMGRDKVNKKKRKKRKMKG